MEEKPRWKKLLRQKLRAIEASQNQWLPEAKAAVASIARDLWEMNQSAIHAGGVLTILRRDHANLLRSMEEHFQGDLLELIFALIHPEFRGSPPSD